MVLNGILVSIEYKRLQNENLSPKDNKKSVSLTKMMVKADGLYVLLYYKVCCGLVFKCAQFGSDGQTVGGGILYTAYDLRVDVK